MLLTNFKNVLIKSILAGICISIGCTAYLLVENKFIGTFLFTIGLFSIIQMKFSLFTGKVGYINKPIHIIEVLIILIGNIIGCGFSSFLLHLTKYGNVIKENSIKIINNKIDDTFISQLILAFFCGILMYIAVESSKINTDKKQDVSNVFGIILPVITFILCGFNHSIADSFYIFSSTNIINNLPYLITIIIGNSIGGLFIPLMKKLIKKDS